MEFRTLKQTDLQVSRLCLGTMTFGKPVEQDEAGRMVDICLDAGVNFIDTANMYQLGRAEEMLGHAIQGRRDRIVLASKVRAKMGEGPNQSGLSKKAIFHAIHETLRRLPVGQSLADRGSDGPLGRSQRVERAPRVFGRQASPIQRTDRLCHIGRGAHRGELAQRRPE